MTKPTTLRNWALAVLAVLALGACNRDWDTGRTAPVRAGSAAAATAAAQDAMGMEPAAGGQGLQADGAAGPRAAFAALPDRGDLVGYPQDRVVRRYGAYTWHRADVSEEHALRAIVDGELRITAPDGQLLAFEYERHVEHPSGDWTWIGRLRDAPPGRQAILTFGAKAVFGNIAQSAAAPLRLDMRDGASWLVETDPVLLAGVESQVLRPEAPDFLLPPFYMGSLSGPKVSGDTVSASGEAVDSSSSTASSTTTVVDVLVGYTPGFATARGGDSQARTRINFLVDVANQGYVNSHIDARVRLVHAMQVSYPDATDNGDTLEKLTGYKSGSGYTTPDPVFSALRDARETYGADLVTLVRKFNTPENDGCGIAWLVGGGLHTITPGYEYFGYSVVSDGIDQGDDGKNYFCREETMAHEFGHNMGSAHDIETSKGDDGVLDNPDDYGRYTYSFGYRTGLDAGNFYTIMAYRDNPNQHQYRVFSNPRITYCGGNPCGTSNADNARSLDQTMPIIAGFRATATTFSDVPPTHWAYSHIEKLYQAGVTGGCATNPLRYCPTQQVLRDSMAVFLLRAKHGPGYQPPAASGIFSDVPTTYWAAAWIEQAWAEGITGGCQSSPLKYCPQQPVARDQMAVLLLRAKHGAGYVPPAAKGVFSDVPISYWAAAWIEQLALEGVTGGCSTSPKKFCPLDVVARDQMAVFLVRNFNL